MKIVLNIREVVLLMLFISMPYLSMEEKNKNDGNQNLPGFFQEKNKPMGNLSKSPFGLFATQQDRQILQSLPKKNYFNCLQLGGKALGKDKVNEDDFQPNGPNGVTQNVESYLNRESNKIKLNPQIMTSSPMKKNPVKPKQQSPVKPNLLPKPMGLPRKTEFAIPDKPFRITKAIKKPLDSNQLFAQNPLKNQLNSKKNNYYYINQNIINQNMINDQPKPKPKIYEKDENCNCYHLPGELYDHMLAYKREYWAQQNLKYEMEILEQRKYSQVSINGNVHTNPPMEMEKFLKNQGHFLKSLINLESNKYDHWNKPGVLLNDEESDFNDNIHFLNSQSHYKKFFCNRLNFKFFDGDEFNL